MTKAIFSALCASALLTTTAVAQQSGHGIDLKNGARELGVMVGSAYACTPDARKPAARDEAETMFDIILLEAGHEVAYQFAVSVGYGAGGGTADVQCDAVIEWVTDVKTDMFMGDD